MSRKFMKAFEMKNLFMTVAVGALMLPSVGWSAADGRGHNGPDLAPVSIPVQLDRGIRADKVIEAMNVCYATGDSNTGVVSMLQRLAGELTGGHANIPEYFYYGASVENHQAFFGGGEILSNISSPGSRYVGVTGLDSTLFELCPKLEATIESDACGGHVDLQYPGMMPWISYSSVTQDTAYDEYGRVNTSGRVLMGVSIHLDPAAYGTSVKLINFETKVKSAITINTVEYVECLKSEIQKRAE